MQLEKVARRLALISPSSKSESKKSIERVSRGFPLSTFLPFVLILFFASLGRVKDKGSSCLWWKKRPIPILIKIQPKTIDLRSRPCGITTELPRASC